MFLAWVIRNWRLVATGVAVLSLLYAGAWFRGVLADRAELSRQNEAQAQEVIDLSGEIERMNKQDAADYALRENIEAQKVQLSEELAVNQRSLKKAKELLNEATRNCLDMPLPQSYLDRLPMPPKGD